MLGDIAASGRPMTDRPRVSVCIPTVNRPDMLREAIASVAAQTLPASEIVIADNSGKAESQKRIDEILGEFPNLPFVLIRHPVQLDAIDNFNSLIDGSRGERWACLPDDDRFCPDFLALSMQALDRHPECAFTFADHWIMRLDGTIDEKASELQSSRFGRTSLREGIYLHSDLFPLVMKQSICLQTGLFRRDVVESLHFIPRIMAGDQSFFMRLSTSSTPFNGYYIDKRVFEYRVHGEQITSTAGRKEMLQAKIDSFLTVSQVPLRHMEEFRAQLSRCYLALALLEAEEGSLKIAREHAFESVHLSLSLRSTAGALLTTAAPFAIRPIRALAKRLHVSP
jgi:glycosyltransferase involved in cell wall biosynthesis